MPIDIKYAIQYPEEPSILELTKILQAATENALVSFTHQTTYYGHIYIETFDKKTYKPLPIEDHAQIARVTFRMDQNTSWQECRNINTTTHDLFCCKEKCLIEFIDCHAEIIFKNRPPKEVQLGLLFIGTEINPKSKSNLKQSAMINREIAKNNDHFFEKLKVWRFIREQMKISPPTQNARPRSKCVIL